MWNSFKLAGVSFHVTPHLKLRVLLHDKLVLYCIALHCIALYCTVLHCCIVRSLPASLPSKGRVTEQETVKWSILSPGGLPDTPGESQMKGSRMLVTSLSRTTESKILISPLEFITKRRHF